jgi:hypothetical protein
VKAAKAHEDEHALELLAKSEEAIEEVVSVFEKYFYRFVLTLSWDSRLTLGG